MSALPTSSAEMCIHYIQVSFPWLLVSDNIIVFKVRFILHLFAQDTKKSILYAGRLGKGILNILNVCYHPVPNLRGKCMSGD